MIVLGYWHEQSRPDRDSYITIHWENIEPKNHPIFDKCTSCTTQGHPYDFESIMHYGRDFFSKNRKPVMSKKGCPDCAIGGHRDNFSQLDIKGINELYSCGSDNPGSYDNYTDCSC